MYARPRIKKEYFVVPACHSILSEQHSSTENIIYREMLFSDVGFVWDAKGKGHDFESPAYVGADT
jgi:hypothetical protein